MLGGMAEFERELIRARTGEGRKRAKERGVRFGRPLKLNAYQRWEALARREAGETLMDIARSYSVSTLLLCGAVVRRPCAVMLAGGALRALPTRLPFSFLPSRLRSST